MGYLEDAQVGEGFLVFVNTAVDDDEFGAVVLEVGMGGGRVRGGGVWG